MARFPELKVDKAVEMARYREYAERISPMVTETISFLRKEMYKGKNVLVEGANAAMLDIDFGKGFCVFYLNFVEDISSSGFIIALKYSLPVQ